MKRFLLGVAVGVALSIGALYSVQYYFLAKFRLQMALQSRGEQDFKQAFPDAGRAIVSVGVGGDEGDRRLMARKDGEYVVNFEYLRDCVFKEIHATYQVKDGKIQSQPDGVLQRLDAAAQPASRKGCASGMVVHP